MESGAAATTILHGALALQTGAEILAAAAVIALAAEAAMARTAAIVALKAPKAMFAAIVALGPAFFAAAPVAVASLIAAGPIAASPGPRAIISAAPALVGPVPGWTVIIAHPRPHLFADPPEESGTLAPMRSAAGRRPRAFAITLAENRAAAITALAAPPLVAAAAIAVAAPIVCHRDLSMC
jgi:hypothetical protein